MITTAFCAAAAQKAVVIMNKGAAAGEEAVVIMNKGAAAGEEAVVIMNKGAAAGEEAVVITSEGRVAPPGVPSCLARDRAGDEGVHGRGREARPGGRAG
jgi:hypothetical protein